MWMWMWMWITLKPNVIQNFLWLHYTNAFNKLDRLSLKGHKHTSFYIQELVADVKRFIVQVPILSDKHYIPGTVFTTLHFLRNLRISPISWTVL